MSEDKEEPNSMDQTAEEICGDDFSKCKSFDIFTSLMGDLCSKYTHLNPKTGKLFEHLKAEDVDKFTLDETGMNFIRGGIVDVVSVWESYVQDLFKEAFDILIKIGSGQQPSLESLSKMWPGCRPVIHELLKEKAKTSAGYELLLSADKGTEKVWIQLLHTHCEKMLEHTTILPIFSNSDQRSKSSIDERFKQLFKTKKEISKLLIGIGGFQYAVRIPRNTHEFTTVNLEPTDASYESAVEALCNISRLYYGLRCTFAHGKHEKTLQGALKDFPESIDDFPLPRAPTMKTNDIKDYYIRLYMWIKKYGKTAWVNYLSFLNITRFYKTAAFFLMLAVAKWLCDTSRDNIGEAVLIWGFNPDRQLESRLPRRPQPE